MSLKKFLISTRGVLIFSFLVINGLMQIMLLFLYSFIRLIMPVPSLRQRLQFTIHHLVDQWAYINQQFLNRALKTQYEILGNTHFDLKKSYILTSNHVTWTDILVIFNVLTYKVPTCRFLMKNELKWQLPIAAQICQLLNFPFVKRYSKEFLVKYPKLKGKDIEQTRKILARFKDIPITVVSFAEGHRFSKKRHSEQQSPYQYLLKPRAGGLAFNIDAMKNNIQSIINLTLIYPSQDITMFDYLCNKIDKITVIIEEIPINEKLIGNYEYDLEFRSAFQKWLNALWDEKDKQLIRYYGKNFN